MTTTDPLRARIEQLEAALRLEVVHRECHDKHAGYYSECRLCGQRGADGCEPDHAASCALAGTSPAPVRPGVYVRDGVAYFAEVDPEAIVRAALERAAAVLDAQVKAHRDDQRDCGIRVCGTDKGFCEDYGCTSLEEYAGEIRALAADPDAVRAIVEGVKP